MTVPLLSTLRSPRLLRLVLACCLGWILGLSLNIVHLSSFLGLPGIAGWASPGGQAVLAQTPASPQVPVPGDPVLGAPVERVPVQINEATLFKVAATPERTATERAKLINLQLKDIVQSKSGAKVTVEERQNRPILLVNDEYLLTVQAQDTDAPKTPAQQAADWAIILQEQLNQAQSLPPESLPKAPVFVNGRPIFELAPIDEKTAADRARIANLQLQAAIASDTLPQVQVRSTHSELAEIRLQEAGTGTSELLVSVTSADTTAPDLSPKAQAELWADDLRSSLRQAQTERSDAARREKMVQALGVLALALGAQVAVSHLWRWCRQRLERWMGEHNSANPYSPRLVNFLFWSTFGTIGVGLWLSVTFYLANLFPVTRQLSYTLRDRLLGGLTNPMIPIGSERYSIVAFVLLGLLLVGLVIVSGTLTDFLKIRFLGALGLDRGVQEAIATVFKYSMIVLGAIILLQIWGLDLSSLTILASALGVGIGFGFQDIAKNFGSGLVLVFERPIQVGDFVEVGQYIGTIEKLGARSTMIRTLDNLYIFIPNSRFLEDEVTNWSHRRTSSRIHIPVGVAYGSDLEKVQAALLEAAQANPNVLKTPEPQVFFKGFGDSSLDFELLVWIARPQQHAQIKSHLNFKIDAAFRRRDISIPFPQRDLHVRSGQPPWIPPNQIQVSTDDPEP